MGRHAVVEPPRTLPELLTIAQVAAYLHLSHWTVRERIARGQIPSIKHGRRVYVLADQLEKVVLRGNLS